MRKLTRDEWTNIGIVAVLVGGFYAVALNAQMILNQISEAIRQLR